MPLLKLIRSNVSFIMPMWLVMTGITGGNVVVVMPVSLAMIGTIMAGSVTGFVLSGIFEALAGILTGVLTP